MLFNDSVTLLSDVSLHSTAQKKKKKKHKQIKNSGDPVEPDILKKKKSNDTTRYYSLEPHIFQM